MTAALDVGQCGRHVKGHIGNGGHDELILVVEKDLDFPRPVAKLPLVIVVVVWEMKCNNHFRYSLPANLSNLPVGLFYIMRWALLSFNYLFFTPHTIVQHFAPPPNNGGETDA
ncbi:hypothetical protein HYALB_00007676 [Hymenoscyphus albidus]|uniref:Uncharacterized protein n=1 Tax=Hymenoscyphus albidus TaxID=595503 RepID=A0A9N9LEF1_9HELO|nr:hypothetical protein HYALB_00007676 [Hymenoscyphus albidus]